MNKLNKQTELNKYNKKTSHAEDLDFVLGRRRCRNGALKNA
jgi:hypothetical protein